MTNVAGKDDNGFPTIFGVSDLDGITPIKIEFDPITRGMRIDSITTISFNPATIRDTNQGTNEYPFAKATASVNSSYTTANVTVRPWVVNHLTGAVLIEP